MGKIIPFPVSPAQLEAVALAALPTETRDCRCQMETLYGVPSEVLAFIFMHDVIFGTYWTVL